MIATLTEKMCLGKSKVNDAIEISFILHCVEFALVIINSRQKFEFDRSMMFTPLHLESTKQQDGGSSCQFLELPNMPFCRISYCV